MGSSAWRAADGGARRSRTRATGIGWPPNTAARSDGSSVRSGLGWPDLSRSTGGPPGGRARARGAHGQARVVAAIAAPPPRRGWHWHQIVAALVVGLVLLAGGALVAGRVLLDRYESSVARDVLLDPSARDLDTYARWRGLTGPLNYLLIGSDLRVANPGAGQRSDSILVVQVDRELQHAYVISIPRDLRVEIPAFGGTSFGGARQQRINAAFEFGGGGSGGVQLLSATLTGVTGMRFDGAAVLDFGGFTQVIDALGGVTMCVDTQVRSIHTKRLFPVGCRQMSGAEALDYSRQRYGLPGGDYDRQRHQQQLIKAILAKALDSGVTRNPIKLDQFITGIGQSLTVDTGQATLTDLVVALRNIRPESLTGIRVPSHPTNIGGVSYVLLDPEADGLFQAMRDADLRAWVQAHPEWVNSI